MTVSASLPLAELAISIEEFRQRRESLMAKFESKSAILIPAAELKIRNRDAEYPFRQDSDFLYLSGFPEPEAVLLMLPDADGGRSVLFCLPRDPEQETWNGYRYGPEGAVEHFGVDEAYSLDQLPEKLVEFLDGSQEICYPVGQCEKLASAVQDCIRKIRVKHRSGNPVPQVFRNPLPQVHELRLIKSPAEQALMRKAGALSAEAHCLAMESCRPGMMEYQLEARMLFHFAEQGARSAAYNTIVGGGANGCILHYTENRDPLRDGDLVLIDAGAEVHGYAGDITRTFPVNGRFSDPQRAIYQLVLDAHQAAMEQVSPENDWNAPHQAALKVLTEGLIALGILEGELEQLLEGEAYRPFYMHRTGHWLGLDVHDVGEYKDQDLQWRALQPGMVLTIEPGLYFAPDNESIDEKWRGIGVRIEDDVLVTETGHENLTDAVPKGIDEIEQLMAASNRKAGA